MTTESLPTRAWNAVRRAPETMWLWFRSKKLVEHIDGLIALLERLFVLLVLAPIIVGTMYGILRLRTATWDQTVAALKFIEIHWMGMAALLLPVVLRPVLIFLEEVQEVMGMKRRPISATSETAAQTIPGQDHE